MKNLKVKAITTEEEARRYFKMQEDAEDIMKYLDIDEVVKSIEQAEGDIDAGRIVGCEKFLEMISKRMSWEQGTASDKKIQFTEDFCGEV